MSASRLATITGEWECTECGYVVEGAEGKRPSRCPECEAPAEALEFYAYDDGDDDWDDSEQYDADEDDEDVEDEDFYEETEDDEDEFDEEDDY